MSTDEPTFGRTLEDIYATCLKPVAKEESRRMRRTVFSEGAPRESRELMRGTIWEFDPIPREVIDGRG